MPRFATALALSVVALASVPALAGASTTLGQTSSTNTLDCGPPITELQSSTGPAPGYAVPAGGGVITGWATARMSSKLT